ncbi:hypothetical protein NU688_32770 [Variovorax sp. ZS18.2.2]|nr:hypothetical protein [Variovorax sp. ZS18.2.2]
MDDLIEARRAALRRFVTKEGGNTAVIKKYNLDPSRRSYLSQLIARDSTAPFGDRSARKWQELLGLQGDPLLYPQPLSRDTITLPIKELVTQIADVLNGVPENQREATAALLAALGRTPSDQQLIVVLTQLLEPISK